MAYPTLAEIEGLLEFELDESERRMAANTLPEVITEACYLGRKWTEADMPAVVAKQIRACMVRYLRRPDGYTGSRAGDENLTWAEGGTEVAEAAGFPRFTKDEVDAIQSAAIGGRLPRFGSFGTTPQGYTKPRGDDAVYVPMSTGGKWFPYFVTGDFR